MKKVVTSVLFVIISSLSLMAQAGPGMQVLQVRVQPQDAPKIIAAFDQWMKGAGKASPNRILLQQHIADGANPATHSFVNLYPSSAASEDFSDSIGADEDKLAEWFAFLDKVTPISQPGVTTRSAHINAWGDVNDSDMVWHVHSLTTSDGASVYRAIDAWMNDPEGKKFPGQLHLMATVAGGPGAPSHIIAVGFKDMAEMEAWGDASRPAAGWVRLLHTLGEVSDYEGAALLRTTRAWGKSTRSVLKR